MPSKEIDGRGSLIGSEVAVLLGYPFAVILTHINSHSVLDGVAFT
jgi:hypothetical protein